MEFFKPNTNFDFLRWRSISLTVSVVLMLLCAGLIFVRGLNYGLDFTGGALVEKIIRVVPPGLGLEIDTASWPLPAVFDWLQREGNVAREEMWRTFNCGIGFVLIAAPAEAAAMQAQLRDAGLGNRLIGEVTAASGGDRVRIG